MRSEIGLGRDWQRMSLAQQRALFGRVVFGRAEVCKGLHGVRVRTRKGKDANGMPRYEERLVSYKELEVAA